MLYAAEARNSTSSVDRAALGAPGADVRYFLLRPRSEPDRRFFSGAGHKLANGLEYDLELSVVSLLQGSELAGDIA